MKKCYYFNLWNLEKFEEKLRGLEEVGFILKEVKFNHIFVFEEKNLKRCNYFIVPLLFKETQDDTFMSNAIETKHHGMKIKMTASSYLVYRTPHFDEQLKFLCDLRCELQRNYYKTFMLIALSFFILFFVLNIIELPANMYDKIVFYIIEILFFLSVIYNFWGYVICRKKVKKIEKKREEEQGTVPCVTEKNQIKAP